jgi:hypothetical protein
MNVQTGKNAGIPIPGETANHRGLSGFKGGKLKVIFLSYFDVIFHLATRFSAWIFRTVPNLIEIFLRGVFGVHWAHECAGGTPSPSPN